MTRVREQGRDVERGAFPPRGVGHWEKGYDSWLPSKRTIGATPSPSWSGSGSYGPEG